jgi:hypothetical protein
MLQGARLNTYKGYTIVIMCEHRVIELNTYKEYTPKEQKVTNTKVK